MERRSSRRIAHHYVIQYKQINPSLPTAKWEISTVRDISKTGICFFASLHYEPGVELAIKIKNPISQKEDRCRATVVRSHLSGRMKDYYEVGVKIDRVEEPKESFYKTIEFFMRKGK